ncbi:MAG: Hpt domain-containing protein, partial [Leptolyngbyaceae cyanobacterium]
MMSDPVISQQVPAYFLQEASELLQQIDTELQTMRQDFSVAKMHSLMRAAHTLKGAAASVGLDAIKTTTHSLEDAFKALCVPDATLTTAVESLIFEAYDCLQLLLSAQISEAQIDESGILDRMANVVAKLQDNLGDQFGNAGYLPTSSELGFDMTQSIFEMGVTQRLDNLENALKTPDPDTLKSLLEAQAEVFFGLAESLNLPGFGEIAQATLTALNHQPEQVVQIATIALKDYRTGQNRVLQGARAQGGAPSSDLSDLGSTRPPRKTSKQR